MKSYLTLGIETSCDETGVAVYSHDRGMLSNALFSQTEIHKNFGGVVPEVASRSQLEKINPIVSLALEKAGITLDDINAIAVTNKPGLAGSLLVGVCFAKAIAWQKKIPLIGINHLEGHVFSACIEHTIPFPFLCITASGGHTSLYLVRNYGDYTVLGQTVDDAAGEAFDKVAKMLNLPYPGGPEIEKLAREIDFKDIYHYPRQKTDTLDFSFSGLKTAVLYRLVNQKAYDMQSRTLLSDAHKLKQEVASSLLVAIADSFAIKLTAALKRHPQVKAVSFVGGVACNNYIRTKLQAVAQAHALPLFVPSAQYCTDNGGMIAFVGSYKAMQGNFSSLELDLFE